MAFDNITRFSISSSLAPGRALRMIQASRPKSWLPVNVGSRSAACAPPSYSPSSWYMPRQHFGAFVAGHQLLDRSRESEIQHRRQLVDARVPRELRHVHALRGHFSEDVEVGNAARARAVEHGRRKGLPELGIHMPRGVDAKSVDAITVDPLAVDIDEALHDARILGHEIVETDEVAEQRALAPEVRIAAVVIVDSGVQPGRHLHVGFGRRHERRVGEVIARQLREVGGGAQAIAGKPGVDRGAPAGRPCANTDSRPSSDRGRRRPRTRGTGSRRRCGW